MEWKLRTVTLSHFIDQHQQLDHSFFTLACSSMQHAASSSTNPPSTLTNSIADTKVESASLDELTPLASNLLEAIVDLEDLRSLSRARVVHYFQGFFECAEHQLPQQWISSIDSKLNSIGIDMSTSLRPNRVDDARQLVEVEMNAMLSNFERVMHLAPKDAAFIHDARLSESRREALFMWREPVRFVMRTKYSWAVPSSNALELIVSLYHQQRQRQLQVGSNPSATTMIEMGAGTGYWAHLLRLRGVSSFDVFDHLPPRAGEFCNTYQPFATCWTRVDRASPSILDCYDNEAAILLLVWPPKPYKTHGDGDDEDGDAADGDRDMALSSIEHFRGELVVYCGELFGDTQCGNDLWGFTSSAAFQIRLASLFDCVMQVPIPTWPGTPSTRGRDARRQ